LLTKQT